MEGNIFKKTVVLIKNIEPSKNLLQTKILIQSRKCGFIDTKAPEKEIDNSAYETLPFQNLIIQLLATVDMDDNLPWTAFAESVHPDDRHLREQALQTSVEIGRIN